MPLGAEGPGFAAAHVTPFPTRFQPPGPEAGARLPTPGPDFALGPPPASPIEPPEPEPGERSRSSLSESRAPRWAGGAGRRRLCCC